MRESVLSLLVCPGCQGTLAIAEARQRDGAEIEEGALRCQGCGRAVPIVRGVPRFAQPVQVEADKRETAEAFGWEWNEFDTLHGGESEERYEEQLLDWIAPLGREHFAGKVVLDAGCGMGRFARVAARFGAREVIAADLSNAVEPARRNTRDLANVTVVQADIYNLPLRHAPVAQNGGAARSATGGNGHAAGREVGDLDFAYSIGVVHHLPDPRAGFHALCRHLRTDGTIFVWVYGWENNQWIARYFSPLREKVLSRLPRRALYALSLGAASALQVPLVALYRPLARSEKLRPLAEKLPYGGYLSWLSRFGLRHNHSVIFDHAVAPTAFYVPRDEFERWFREAGFETVELSWRNRNSWRGFGAGRQL